MVELRHSNDSANVKRTWLDKLNADLSNGTLTETQEVIDYRTALNAVDTSLGRDDVVWPVYPNA